MFCEKCGTKLEENDMFCPKCGNPIEDKTLLTQDVGQECIEYANIPDLNLAKKSNHNFVKWICAGMLGIFVIVAGLIVVGAISGWHVKHDWTEATCTEPETCITGGETRGEASGHNWAEATCTEPEICTVCEENRGEASGHTYTEPTCTEAAVCTVCGEIGQEASGHTYTEPTCTEAAICTACGEMAGEAMGHIWEGGSCSEPQLCSVCGAKNEVLGHDWNVEYATCEMDKKCNRCQTIEEYALGHELIDSGICRRCKEQAGIMLTPSNFQPYLTLALNTKCNDHMDNGKEYYTYWYKPYIKDKNAQYKFHNVIMQMKVYLTTDISKGEKSAIEGTIHEVTIVLDEDGEIVEKSITPQNMELQMLGKWSNRSDLKFYGYIYEMEGFCYDPSIATVDE